MADTEITRLPEDRPVLGKDVNRILDIALGNDGAQRRAVGYSGVVKDPNTGVTTTTGAFTDVIQNTGGQHVAVLLAATGSTAVPTPTNAVLLVQDVGLTVGAGTYLRLSNVAGGNFVILTHSGTDDVLQLTGGLNITKDLAVIEDVTVTGNATVTGMLVGVSPKCRVYNTANISVADSAFQTLTFNSERWDNDTIHDTGVSPGRLTCKTAGLYQIEGCMSYQASAVGVRGARIRLNGSTSIEEDFRPTAGATVATRISIGTQYQLAVNDYVELQAYQDSGGALDVVAATQYSPEFMMTRIG